MCLRIFRVSGWLLPVSITTTPCEVTTTIAFASLSFPTYAETPSASFLNSGLSGVIARAGAAKAASSAAARKAFFILVSLDRAIRRLDIVGEAVFALPVFGSRNFQFLFDLVERFALLDHSSDAFHQGVVIILHVVENFRRAGNAVAGNDDFGLERFHRPDRVERVGNADERRVIAEALYADRGRGEQHALLRQPDRRIRLAVDVFQIIQLEGPLADVERHPVAVFDVGRHEPEALERVAHLGRFRRLPLDARRAERFRLFHRRGRAVGRGANTKSPMTWSG